MDKQEDSTEITKLQSIENSIMGRDEAMGEKHPSAPGWLVAATYPLLLIVVIAGAMVYFSVTYVNRDELPTLPKIEAGLE